MRARFFTAATLATRSFGSTARLPSSLTGAYALSAAAPPPPPIDPVISTDLKQRVGTTRLLTLTPPRQSCLSHTSSHISLHLAPISSVQDLPLEVHPTAVPAVWRLSRRRRYGATLITVDADETPHLFGADFFHINMAGHRHVANSIWRDFKQLPCAAFRPAALGHGGHATGMECAIAEDLDLLVGRRSSGFERVNLGQDRGVSKIGYDATAPGASLDLCVDLPRQAVQDALSELAKVTVQRSGVNAYDPSRAKERLLHGDAFALSVGIQTSHPKNLPLHGRVRRAPTYIF